MAKDKNLNDLSPAALIGKQEQRVTNSIKQTTNTDDEIDTISDSIDDLKKTAFSNKAKALYIVSKALDSINLDNIIDVSDLKDLVNINDTIAKSLVDTRTDEQGLQVLIQQMFQNYNGTPPATPIKDSECKINVTEMLSGKN